MKQTQRPKTDHTTETEPAAQPETRWRWAIWLAVGAVLLAISSALARDRLLHGWELQVFRTINDWPHGLYYFFLVATIFPSSLWIAAAAVIAAFLSKSYHLAVRLSAAIFGGYAVAVVVMKLIDRARPSELVPNVHQRITDSGLGFPSGHTMIMTVIVLTCWPLLPKGWRWLTLLLIPLMGLSRLYLGVHAPLDIVGGFAIGVMSVAFLEILPGRLRKILRLE